MTDTYVTQPVDELPAADVDPERGEVGLGGRLDATTALRPVVTALATVSFDHVAVLGPTATGKSALALALAAL